jgi:hypothetical protein
VDSRSVAMRRSVPKFAGGARGDPHRAGRERCPNGSACVGRAGGLSGAGRIRGRSRAAMCLHRIRPRVLAPVVPPRGRVMPAVSEVSGGGPRRDHGRSRDVTLPSRCRDMTRGHDLGSGRHRPRGYGRRSGIGLSGAIATRLGHHRTTGHQGISRDGDSGPVLSSPWPAVPPVVRIPPAGRCQAVPKMARTKPICSAI